MPRTKVTVSNLAEADPGSLGAVLQVRKGDERFTARPARNYFPVRDASLGPVARFFRRVIDPLIVPVDSFELLHQRLVDLEAAGGVDDHDVAALRTRLLLLWEVAGAAWAAHDRGARHERGGGTAVPAGDSPGRVPFGLWYPRAREEASRFPCWFRFAGPVKPQKTSGQPPHLGRHAADRSGAERR